ncbi:MAG: hypothetical protein V7754_20090 [Halioglobus sp.]
MHGWSVTHTNTYGDLPESLSQQTAVSGLDLDVAHIHLGKYISFHDEVTLDDIARALDVALRALPGNESEIQPFSCITHSTGGPVVRHWVNQFYGGRKLSAMPLVHLVMLAPANHGSSLAVLGKERVGRIKSWFSGVEPGEKILDWLSLGSAGQWQLNTDCLGYKYAGHGFYPFVLTGQGIDTAFYDFVNSYLVEKGSDGVVRAAGANMNYRYLELKQSDRALDSRGKVLALECKSRGPVKCSEQVPTGILSAYSHSGKKMGVMAVSRDRSAHGEMVSEIAKCLGVASAKDYAQRDVALATLTAEEQAKAPRGQREKVSRYCMLVFRVRDHTGTVIASDDIDIVLLAGKRYSPDKLPKGFFVDRQLNPSSHSLVYYVDADTMAEVPGGFFGIRVVVRPQQGFAYYATGEFRSEKMSVQDVFAPNETTYIDVVVNRFVDENVFQFSSAEGKRESFKKVKPSGRLIDPV